MRPSDVAQLANYYLQAASRTSRSLVGDSAGSGFSPAGVVDRSSIGGSSGSGSATLAAVAATSSAGVSGLGSGGVRSPSTGVGGAREGTAEGAAPRKLVLSQPAIRRMQAYPWPGNEAELQTTMDRAARQQLAALEAQGKGAAAQQAQGQGQGQGQAEVVEVAEELVWFGGSQVRSALPFFHCLHGILASLNHCQSQVAWHDRSGPSFIPPFPSHHSPGSACAWTCCGWCPACATCCALTYGLRTSTSSGWAFGERFVWGRVRKGGHCLCSSRPLRKDMNFRRMGWYANMKLFSRPGTNSAAALTYMVQGDPPTKRDPCADCHEHCRFTAYAFPIIVALLLWGPQVGGQGLG